jgi:uncharacterized protein (TIGR00255 family)
MNLRNQEMILLISSMTGFGRGSSEDEGKRSFTVEIKSINHRYLDINIRMPRALISLEEKIRKCVNEKISRGKVDIFVTYNNYAKAEVEANFNTALADSYVKCLAQIKERYNLKDEASISLIARFPDVVYVEEKEENLEEIWNLLRSSTMEALDSLVKMRLIEGEKLSQDIGKKCENIHLNVQKIEEKAPRVVESYKVKITERLKELVDLTQLDENRINMELAIYADKSSIDEEITRLNSHISQLLDTVKSNEVVGRKLDFIVQEMNREANTIASKSVDLEITNYALNIKNEIEKIREQIQNIE